MAEPLITMAAAARETGIPYDTLRRLVIARRIASVRVAGIRRVRLNAVRRALEEIPVDA